MDVPKNANVSVPALIVLYDFQYTAKDKREITMRKGEKLYLIQKTNKDWWQVVRQSERRSFYVPAQYVEVIPKEKLPLSQLDVFSGNRSLGKAEYENINLENHKAISNIPYNTMRSPATAVTTASESEVVMPTQVANVTKPVPKTRTKVLTCKLNCDSSSESKLGVSDSKNISSMDIKTDPSEKMDKLKRGDKIKPELSLSLPKNSDQLTKLMDDDEGRHCKKVSASETQEMSGKGKNLPRGRSKLSQTFNDSDQIDNIKNRMKSSYNLRSSRSFDVSQRNLGKFTKKDSGITMKSENPNLSKSLERLAQEIKFQPKDVDPSAAERTPLSHHSGADKCCSPVSNTQKQSNNNNKTDYSSNNNSNNANNHNKNDNNRIDAKREKVQKAEDQTIQSQSKGSVFSRIKRSLHHSSSFKSSNLKKIHKGDKKACELSLSWEGGLDKAVEIEKDKKLNVTISGLQRSRTFMVAERSPTIFRHTNALQTGRNRVDVAYHSQKLPNGKKELSTFKPVARHREPLSECKSQVMPFGEVIRSPPTHRRGEGVNTVEEKGTNEGIYSSRGDSAVLKRAEYENVAWAACSKSPAISADPIVVCNEVFSHSESEDNSEVKILSITEKGQDGPLRNRGSIDSNMAQSEGTELSESDENGSLDLDAEKHSVRKEPLNKRRTSLVRNRRVSGDKSRSVTARQLPPSPTPEDQPTKDLGNGWNVYLSSDNRTYYYNKATGEKSWKPPRRDLSYQENRYVGSRESICSDTSGSIIRSSTSSPSNDRVLSNSLNRSNASLSSRSACFDNLGYDIIKSSSGCSLKEDNVQGLSRSSLNSSPATCQSRSSSYSLIKSSRDSLNRCSPIENIPSEDDDIELHDHVYQEYAKGDRFETVSEEESDSKVEEKEDEENMTMGVPIPPGWTECYDNVNSQFFYVHKDTKQKIRNQVECYEDNGNDNPGSLSSRLNTSSASIYDNVLGELLGAEQGKVEEEEEDEAETETEKVVGLWGQRRILETIAEESAEGNSAAEDGDCVSPDTGEVMRALRARDATDEEHNQTKGIIQEEVEPVTNLLATNEGKPNTSPRKMCCRCVANGRDACYDDTFSEILNKIESDISDLEERMIAIEVGKRDLTASVRSVDSKDIWSKLHSGHLRCHPSPEDIVPRLSTFKPPLPPGRRRTRPSCRTKALGKKNRTFRKQFLTLLRVLQSIDESNCRRFGGRNCDCRVLDEEGSESEEENAAMTFPAMDSKMECETRELLLKVTDSLKERRRTANGRRSNADILKSGPRWKTVENCRIETEQEAVGSLPEEVSEPKLVIRALHERLNKERANSGFTVREDVIIDWESDYDNLSEPVVLEGKSLHRRPAAGRLMDSAESSRMLAVADTSIIEDEIILDRKNGETTREMENVIGYEETDAELASAEGCSENGYACEVGADEITSFGGMPWDDGRLPDKANPDKTSVSSMGDYEDTLSTTYSDFENDLNETIHLGETWCREERSFSEETDVSNLTACPDLDVSAAESGPSDADAGRTLPLPLGPLPKIAVRPLRFASATNLTEFETSQPVRSRSADFFRDSATESRLLPARASSTESVRSDVIGWIAKLRGIVFVEDKSPCDDREEWFTSFDPEGRLYFFDELSNESSWALPSISSDGSNFIIQRSATESSLPKNTERSPLDGEKRRSRPSASSRSSKTQSMVIEPKLELPSSDDNKAHSMPRDLTKIYGEIIRSGMLNKTKISENGKKLRKNWSPAFVVLSNTKLLFFKDAKTFHSMKPANDSMCLNLKGAVIEKGDKISSKKNVYKVNSMDHTEVLIQTDRTSDADEWFKDIVSVIQNLPLESNDTSSSSLEVSLSKVGRTKSVKAKGKDSGSMEDLSLNPEERQSKIRAKLKKFFNRRPTVDSLKKKGIWKDEPVFGCSLEQITKNRNPRVPIFVEKCIECIESKEENLKTDGLYRASGNLSQVQKIRLEVDQNNLNVLKEEEDVHVLTGSLKLFFRELKDPLIPFKQLVPALSAINNPKRKEKVKEYRKIVSSLPGPNYDTLKFLLQHLLRVEKYNEFNRMNVNNLAIVFGPTLMWPEQESTNMALDFMQQNLVIECLLREFQEIFT